MALSGRHHDAPMVLVAEAEDHLSSRCTICRSLVTHDLTANVTKLGLRKSTCCAILLGSINVPLVTQTLLGLKPSA